MNKLELIANKYPVYGLAAFGSLGGSTSLLIKDLTIYFHFMGAFFGAMTAFLSFLGAVYIAFYRVKKWNKERKDLKRRSGDSV